MSRSSDVDDQPSDSLVENISEVTELLRIALVSQWNIHHTESATDFPAVPLSAPQLVQILLNLGLLAADALKKPGQIGLYLSKPDADARDLSRFAAIITLSASADAADLDNIMELRENDSQPAAAGMVDAAGVISSVVRALIEDAGGRLDEIYVSSIKRVYRVCLPFAEKIWRAAEFKSSKIMIKDDLRLKQRRILLAYSDWRLDRLEKILKEMGAIVVKMIALDLILSAIDAEPKPDVIIADKRIFGAEADSLLKAVRKICPNSAIIIISRKTGDEKLSKEKNFAFLDPDGPEEEWLDLIAGSRPLMTL